MLVFTQTVFPQGGGGGGDDMREIGRKREKRERERESKTIKWINHKH